jgi:DNA polymerase-3 subunit epsilon
MAQVNNLMAWDFETTGLPLFREPSDHPDRPHIVQLAALLIDPDTLKEIDSCDLIVRPDGWIISDEVAAIHGITTERAMDEGVAESYVVERLMEMADRASLRIAHNISFDDRLARISMMRHGIPRDIIEAREARPKFCTMSASGKIMKMAPTAKMAAAGITRSKPPRLSEAYLHFFGEEMAGAHNALHDVAACLRVYLHLLTLQPVEA